MTVSEFEQYKILINSSYKDYVLNLAKEVQVRQLDLKYEFDTKLWILSKAISVILDFDMNGNNAFTTLGMLKWQTIMNNIMQTRRFIDFKIE